MAIMGLVQKGFEDEDKVVAHEKEMHHILFCICPRYKIGATIYPLHSA